MVLRFFILATLIPSLSCYGANPYEAEESKIPKHPSSPPLLLRKSATAIPHCERYFLYQGKRYECDSNLGKDADRLRSIVSDVPDALAELDLYQKNREKMKVTGYIGSIGVVALITGIIMSRPATDPTTGSLRTGGYITLGGIGLAVGSLIYGFTRLRANEAHVGNAVQFYNSVHPDRPIELQFSTQINF